MTKSSPCLPKYLIIQKSAVVSNKELCLGSLSALDYYREYSTVTRGGLIKEKLSTRLYN